MKAAQKNTLMHSQWKVKPAENSPHTGALARFARNLQVNCCATSFNLLVVSFHFTDWMLYLHWKAKQSWQRWRPWVQQILQRCCQDLQLGHGRFPRSLKKLRHSRAQREAEENQRKNLDRELLKETRQLATSPSGAKEPQRDSSGGQRYNRNVHQAEERWRLARTSYGG